MAFIKNKLYIKLTLTDEHYIDYIIYTTKADRNKAENESIKIMAKYQEIINKLLADKETLYYDPTATELLNAWSAEYANYINDSTNHKLAHKFPLMKKIIKNVEKTIINITAKGTFGYKAETVAEAYMLLKKVEAFPDAEDDL